MGLMKDGFFVVIEGIDGSGKSTITRKLVKVLQITLGKNVKLTFEPHDPSCAGLFIRQILMRKLTDVPPRTLALAFAVNRADHCDREIEPFFRQTNGIPRLVVCDRYYLSSLVYQRTDALSFDEIMRLNSSVRKPDLTIFLSASANTCYERMRNRQEAKELFEISLNKTKLKYAEAITYLTKRGEKIIEVQAEGSFSDVLGQVVKVIVDNSPPWLTLQQQLPLIDETWRHLFEPQDITLVSFANEFFQSLDLGAIKTQDQMADLLDFLETNVNSTVESMSFDRLATLFFDIIREAGYDVRDRLPWTDIEAFEMQYQLPLRIVQRGAALLLGETQRYDSVMARLLSDAKTLRKMSDFLFILDSNPSHLRTDYFEREVTYERENQTPLASLSPSLQVIGRKEIAGFVLKKVLDALSNKEFSLPSFPELLKTSFKKLLCQQT